MTSHVLTLGSLGEELAIRGHDVYLLAKEGLSLPGWVESQPQMTVIRYGDARSRNPQDIILASASSIFENKGSMRVILI